MVRPEGSNHEEGADFFVVLRFYELHNIWKWHASLVLPPGPLRCPKVDASTSWIGLLDVVTTPNFVDPGPRGIACP